MASDADDHQEGDAREQLRDYVSRLPSAPGGSHANLYRHPDGWYATMPVMVGVLTARRHFTARRTDVLLATFPKSGTVWLKALLFATVRRAEGLGLDALAAANPHELVPFLESQIYAAGRVPDETDLHLNGAPRLLSTHIPYPSLPPSADSGCKVMYLCRGAKDTLVSLWHFANKIRAGNGDPPLPLDAAVDQFCAGTTMFGPYWEHVLGYWRGHFESPERIMFLRYEEVSAAPAEAVRRMADFLGCPFGVADEDEVQRVVQACGIEKLRGLEINRSGKTELVHGAMDNHFFFRKGLVGDWSSWLSPELARRIDDVSERRFAGSGIWLE